MCGLTCASDTRDGVCQRVGVVLFVGSFGCRVGGGLKGLDGLLMEIVFHCGRVDVELLVKGKKVLICLGIEVGVLICLTYLPVQTRIQPWLQPSGGCSSLGIHV